MQCSLRFYWKNLLFRKNFTFISRKTSETFQARLQKPELWFAGILECVVYLSFYAAKNFFALYALESGISILWVWFFYNAWIDSSYVSSVWSPFDRQHSLLTSRLFRNAAGSLFSLGMFTLGKSLSFCSCLLSWFLAWQKPWFPLSPLALFAKRMDVHHTGARVGLMSAPKNCG